MTYIAIIGSRVLDEHPRAIYEIQHILDEYPDAVIVSGGAKGIDSMAVELAKKTGHEVIEFLPKGNTWPKYKLRNMEIASQCDVLYSIRAEWSSTYGAGWTADYAQSIGKEVHRILIKEV